MKYINTKIVGGATFMRDKKQITLRLPDEVYEALEKAGTYLGFNLQNLILIAILHSIGKLKCKL